jgi:hypothetical protein
VRRIPIHRALIARGDAQSAHARLLARHRSHHGAARSAPTAAPGVPDSAAVTSRPRSSVAVRVCPPHTLA